MELYLIYTHNIFGGKKDMTKQYLMSEALGNELLQYLATKPYAEVYKLVGGLQQMPEFTPNEKCAREDVPQDEELAEQ
jgi:hypothetical protein